MVLPEEREIVFPGLFCPVAVKLDLLVLQMPGGIDVSDPGEDIGGERGDSYRVQLFEYPVADTDDRDDGIAGRRSFIGKRRGEYRRRIRRGPVEVKIPDIQGADVIVMQNVPFRAIEGEGGFPIIEAQGFGPLLTGRKATSEAKAEQSKISDRHRKKIISHKGNVNTRTKGKIY